MARPAEPPGGQYARLEPILDLNSGAGNLVHQNLAKSSAPEILVSIPDTPEPDVTEDAVYENLPAGGVAAEPMYDIPPVEEPTYVNTPQSADGDVDKLSFESQSTGGAETPPPPDKMAGVGGLSHLVFNSTEYAVVEKSFWRK